MVLLCYDAPCVLTWIPGWGWACRWATPCSRLWSGSGSRPPRTASPGPTGRRPTSGWRSRTGRAAGRRRALLLPLLLLPGAAPSPPACSPGRGASGCSCCTGPCTACRGAWPARPSRRRPAAARSATGWGRASGAASPGRGAGSPGGGMEQRGWLYRTVKTSKFLIYFSWRTQVKVCTDEE